MMLMRSRFVGCVALLLFSATGFAADQKTQDLYKSKCQGCHGPDGKASVIGKKLGAKGFSDPEVVKMSESDLLKIMTDGKNKMPSYKDRLTREQIKDLVRYVRELK